MVEERERAFLVGIELPGASRLEVEESLAELARLADTAGALVVGTALQRRQRPDASTFLGKGRAREIGLACSELEANLVICDRELSPAQARNLEEIVEVRVIDRTQLILDIFARRARTKEGKLQVETAQLNYLLPRLTGKGIGLSRLGGGIGTRGPGETKLEVDRRRIRKRISDLRKELQEVQRHRQLLRQGRKDIPLPLVALVGYTNAGKSTLLRTLTGADVLVEDKLFATLDPTTRQVVLPNNEMILLTDTVGFINNLPHHLVAAFRATLEEVVEADLLLHVVDAGHPNMEAQIKSVERVLASLQFAGEDPADDGMVLSKPMIMVFNKIDQMEDAAKIPPDTELPRVYVSALKGTGLKGLLEEIARALSPRRVRVKYFIPYEKGSVLGLIHERGRVIQEEHTPDGVSVEAEMPEVWARRLENRLKDGMR